MGIKYNIVEAKLTYPLVDVVVNQVPMLDENGEPKVTRRQKFLDNGLPDIELVPIGKKSDGLLAKRPKWVETPDLEDVYEAQENLDAPPDGITYQVEAWDEKDKDGKNKINLKFHIGRSVFENYQPHQRQQLLRKEIEILYTRATADWTEGLELS